MNDDNSVCALHPAKIEELELFRGDCVQLRGKKRKQTVCILLEDDTCKETHVRLNRVGAFGPFCVLPKNCC